MAQDAQNGGAPQITGTVPYYRQPEPLTAAAHGNLGIMKDADHLAAFADAYLIPVMALEFPAASAFYPIIFGGDAFAPVVVMGLAPGQNVFVTPERKMPPHTYVPGFIRRYPFALAQNPQDGQGIVCIDRSHPAIQENADMPFFVDGKPSQDMINAIDFLRDYEQLGRDTQAMVAELRALDLFDEMTVSFTLPGASGPSPVANYRAVNETKLRALSAEKLKELQDKGYLALVYAHLLSLNNWNYVVSRSIERGWLGQTAPAAN